MTSRLIAGAALAGLLLAGSGLAGPPPLKSGPPVGARNNRSGFFPQFVAGPGTPHGRCPVWTGSADLVALVFVRELSDPLTSLVKKIDRQVDAAAGKYAPRRELGTYVIVADAPGQADRLRGLARKEGLRRVSLCVGTAPPGYEISNEAALTVVIYNPDRRGRQQVQANFALRKGELNDAKCDAIVAALAKVLPR